MEKVKFKSTVFFDNPFWIGVFERESKGIYEVCKVTFGSEPKDCEIYDFLLKNWCMLKFSSSLKSENTIERKIGYKRKQRLIRSELHNTGSGTKSQHALKIQHEQSKVECKENYRKLRDLEKQHKFELHQIKKKTKHKGH